MAEGLLLPWLGAIGMVLTTAPVGCFLVWQRMAFFGDALAHSALLGIALGLLLGLGEQVGMLLTGVALAGWLVLLRRSRIYAADTLLGVFAHVGLAAGILVASQVGMHEHEIHDALFGEITRLKTFHLYWVYGTGAVVIAVVGRYWKSLLLLTLNRDLAQVEGVPVMRLQLLFMLLVALAVAVGVKLMGVLLVSALLIIPAAAARAFAKTPSQMVGLAGLWGVLAVSGGLVVSAYTRVPEGPVIALAAGTLFVLALLFDVCFGRARILRRE